MTRYSFLVLAQKEIFMNHNFKKLIYPSAFVAGLFALATLYSPQVGMTLPSASESDKQASTPLKEIEGTINRIVSAVQDNPGEGKTVERRAKLRELINPQFDFSEMAQRSLGSHWKEATVDERAEFVKVFSDLLARTYLNRIETVKPGMVKMAGEEMMASSPGGAADDASSKALVKTMVTHNGDVFPINYRLFKKDNEWKVYDVIIENIGLVSNYRNEFAGIIRKEKLSGLIQRLKDKNEAAQADLFS